MGNMKSLGILYNLHNLRIMDKGGGLVCFVLGVGSIARDQRRHDKRFLDFKKLISKSELRERIFAKVLCRQ
jgi:hypothetical protein